MGCLGFEAGYPSSHKTPRVLPDKARSLKAHGGEHGWPHKPWGIHRFCYRQRTWRDSKDPMTFSCLCFQICGSLTQGRYSLPTSPSTPESSVCPGMAGRKGS